MGLLGLLVAFGLLPGVLLLVWGWSGKRVGDHPHCARCRFDLFGVYPGADDCPECGQELWLPGAVVDGQPVRRRRPLVAGAVLVAVSLSLLGVFTAWAVSSSTVYAAMPGPLLVRVMEAPEARGEAVSRLQAGTLSAGGARVAIERALDVQGDPAVTWDPSWGAVIEAAWNGGFATPADLQRYATQATDWRLAVRPRVGRGFTLRATLDATPAPRLGLGTTLELTAKTTSVEIDGRAVERDPGYFGRLRCEITFDPTGSSRKVHHLPVGSASRELGTRKLTVRFEPTYRLRITGAAAPLPPFTEPPAAVSQTVEVVDGFTGRYLPPTDPAASPAARAENTGVWVGEEQVTSGSVRTLFVAVLASERLTPDGLKYWARLGDRVFPVGPSAMTWGHQGGRHYAVVRFRPDSDFLDRGEVAERVDLIVRPDIEHAETTSSADPARVWCGEWVVRDIPLDLPATSGWDPTRSAPPPKIVPVGARTLTPEAAMRPVTAADFD
ncbi:MAG: hypothetical protein AAF710_01820 [Planctomycetota bacterium]